MAGLTVKARVGSDGALQIPEDIRLELELAPGDVVELVLYGKAPEEDNPLLRIVGLGEGRPDGSENHDKYLYAPPDR